MKNREKECEEFLVCKEDYIKVELKGSIFDTS
jgi:hypothetical protein